MIVNVKASIVPPLPTKSTDNDKTLIRNRLLTKQSRRLSKNKIEIGPPNEFKSSILNFIEMIKSITTKKNSS